MHTLKVENKIKTTEFGTMLIVNLKENNFPITTVELIHKLVNKIFKYNNKEYLVKDIKFFENTPLTENSKIALMTKKL